MLINSRSKIQLTASLIGFFLVMVGPDHSYGFVCSGSMYNDPAFEKKITNFSPYEKVYLIVECTGLKPGEYTMHANWIHQQRGMIRSDKHSFTAEDGKKQGLYFWFNLSKKGPMASMFSGQDFHEKNFGDWSVEAYLNDKLILTNPFRITEEVSQ